MPTKVEVRDTVEFILRETIADHLLRRSPDVYYGWVPKYIDPRTGEVTPGYYMGEAEINAARYELYLAKQEYKNAQRAVWRGDPVCDEWHAASEKALAQAEQRLEEEIERRDRMVVARRDVLIARRLPRLFLRMYRKAITFDWDLYNPAIPESLREYALRQRARGMGPTSTVYLYLLLQQTIDHGADFQTEAITGINYLADNKLVVSTLDIDEPEGNARREKRAYIRELQAKAIRDRATPSHENLDPRDALADFEYDGLPEQRGVLWLDKSHDNSCYRCKQGLRVRIVHAAPGYRWAKVCPNYQNNPECHYEEVSPMRATRKELWDWAAVEMAAGVA